MALSGKVSTATWTGETTTCKVILSWTAKQNLENNTSEISWELKPSVSKGYVVVSELRVTIDGTVAFYRSHNQHTDGWTGTVLASDKTTIAHNEDGSKDFTIKVEAGIHEWAINKRGEDTFTLDPIPRASEIGATDANIGSKSSVVVTKKATSYTHSIRYEFEGLSGYITSNGGVSTSEVKFSAATVSFTVPTSFYAQIPNAKNGKCKLTCTTYSGITKIGVAKTTEFTVTAAEPSCKPEVSGTIVDSNETTKALTGDASKLIKYYSDALCTIKATAKNSATVKTKKIGDTTVSGNTRTIPAVETESIAFAATDSRGYSTSVTVKTTLINYIKLTVNAQLHRVDPTSGKVVLTVKGNYFNSSFGAVANTLTCRYRLAKSGESYGSWVAVTPTKSGNSYSLSVNLSGLDYRYSYSVQVQCYDKLRTLSPVATVNQGIPVADWGANDFRFNVPVTLSGHQIKGLADPEDEEDAINLKYLEDSLAPYAKKSVVVTESGTNLNNYTVEGWYFFTSTAVTPINIPAGTNGWLHVISNTGTNSIAYTKQTFYRLGTPGTNDYQTFVRTYAKNQGWGAWTRYTTEKDTYRKVKLWENANLSNAFNAQTISLDLSDYDGVEILCYVDKSTNVYFSTGFLKKGLTSVLSYTTASAGYRLHRNFTINSNGIQFQTATNTGAAAVSGVCIPYIIYGVKGVS